jgi:glutathione S-transferase
MASKGAAFCVLMVKRRFGLSGLARVCRVAAHGDGAGRLLERDKRVVGGQPARADIACAGWARRQRVLGAVPSGRPHSLARELQALTTSRRLAGRVDTLP